MNVRKFSYLKLEAAIIKIHSLLLNSFQKSFTKDVLCVRFWANPLKYRRGYNVKMLLSSQCLHSGGEEVAIINNEYNK